jgi:cAMP-specific phosphodiesterase 4
MAHHFKLVSRLNELVALGKKNDIINGSPMKSTVITNTRDDDSTNVSVTFKTDDERQLMLNVLLHCADISNAVKPNELCVKWASRVLEEFFNQGDRERSRGMSISPMMDRETTSVGLSQINFIEFVIAPLYVQFVAVFPALSSLLTRLIENRRYYQETYENELIEMTEEDGVDRSSEKESLRARFRTLIEKHSLRRFVNESDHLMKAVLSLPHTRRSSAHRSLSAALSSPSMKKKV